MSELESGFQLGDALSMLRRQIAVVLAAVVIGAVVGYLVLSSAPSKYSATARVEVGPNPLTVSGNGTPTPPTMETEQDLVKSDAVADSIRKKLKLPGDNRAVLGHITVTIAEKSNVLQVTYQAGNGAEARDGANAAAAAYLAQRQGNVAESLKRRTKALTAQINDQQAPLRQAQQDLDDARGGPDQATAQAAYSQISNTVDTLTATRADLTAIDVGSVGSIVRKAPDEPALVTSKMALAKGVGIFGLIVLAGLAAAWLLDRRDLLGGGKRRLEHLLPNAAIRVLPGAEGRAASAAELDTAIDRLAVELVNSNGSAGPAAVLIMGAGSEPPVGLAEELASSLTFAGIPALFVLAGTSDRQLRHAHVVASFADLLTGPSVSGPASLPAEAGGPATTGGTSITWLRPRGSVESSGLLRRTVVDTLVARAGREHFEAVIFVTASPARTAAATALSRWVQRTALVVGAGERSEAEIAARALADAEVSVSEVVWT